MNNNFSVAENLKSLIKDSGLKAYVVAERAGIDPRQLSDMINGRRIIKASDLPSLANALGVTPNALFGIKKSA